MRTPRRGDAGPRASDDWVVRKAVSDQKDKPVLDEQTLGRLLEAAFVLQEHNRELQKLERNLDLQTAPVREQERSLPIPPRASREASPGESAPGNEYTSTLAQIVETQHQIQVRHLELEEAMSLVVMRLAEITNAGGAAIGILDGNKVRYRVVAGSMTLPAGAEVPMEKALCLATLRTGQVIRCVDVNPEFLFDPAECRRRGIQSLIAVPVYHDGGIAGAMELYFAYAQAFTEQDVHTCQLIAGLVTEALAREEEHTWKKSLATERAVMMEALAKLKPNLAALLDKAVPKNSSSASTGARTASPAEGFFCRKCGHELVGEEQFCGKCGSARSGDYEAPRMQSKVASLWQIEEGAVVAPVNGSATGREKSSNLDRSQYRRPLADSIAQEFPDFLIAPQPGAENAASPSAEPETIDAEEFEEAAKPQPAAPLVRQSGNEGAATETALVKSEDKIAWSSAARAKDFLERLVESKNQSALGRFWNARRGDIYLAIAVILVAGVIRWGIWSDHSVSATGKPAAGQRRVAPGADLSMFDRMLISLGMADPPPAPEYKGNPDTQVWVDLHTALYYCPGTDLYGKTQKGKFTSQKDAQLDQFEPAYRRACD